MLIPISWFGSRTEFLAEPMLPGTCLLGSRATTTRGLYQYNGVVISEPRAAYAFRMTAAVWLADDPLKDTELASHYIRVGALPGNRPEYQPGRISWSDWKPITGDNAWAFLVGPLHAAYLHYVVANRGSYIPFEDHGVQNALGVLPTFSAMQSASGAIYYAPSGTLGNASDKPVGQYLISVENNLSVYAGLRILDSTLAAELAHETDLDSSSRRRIADSRMLIATMVSGGTVREARRTKGLLAFLKNCAWRDGEFVQAGYANDPGAAGEWVAVTEPKAVDVNTWGVAALGPEQIDRWFGFGSAFRVWERLKSWGAYGVGHTIWGVGYSDLDGNGQTADGSFRSGILSAEWTAGAIVMVRSMLRHYATVPGGSDTYARAQKIVGQLRSDEDDMIRGIQELRFDRYVAGSFPGKREKFTRINGRTARPARYATLSICKFPLPDPIRLVRESAPEYLCNGVDPLSRRSLRSIFIWRRHRELVVRTRMGFEHSVLRTAALARTGRITRLLPHARHEAADPRRQQQHHRAADDAVPEDLAEQARE